MRTSLLFSTILVALFITNLSNAQCNETVSSFGNNSSTPSYNIIGDVTVTLNTKEQTIKLDLGSNFRTATGPDVRAYLVKSNGKSNSQLATNSLPSGNIHLGLVSGSGVSPNGPKSFTADIPSGTAIGDYDTVFFFCFRFSAFWDLGKFTPFSSSNCSTLGIEDSVLSKAITTYPNPITDELHINNNNVNTVGIKFYSIIGELLFEEKNSSKKTINTSHLSSGMYLVELSSGGKRLTKKIVKK